MPTKIRQSPLILDAHGRPATYSTFYEASVNPRNSDARTPSFYHGFGDTTQLVTARSFTELLWAGRFLFANVPILRGALLEQATYSFPLQARYCGKDKEWGKIAEHWLYSWKLNSDVKGAPYDSHTASRIRLISRLTDGDIFRLLVHFGTDGFPKLQFVRAHRVGDRIFNFNGVIADGEYKGKRLCNGAVLNEYGAVLAYKVLGDVPAADQFIPSSSLFPCYNPDYSDQNGRGISPLAAAITSFADVKRLREYEMRAQQIQASYALTEANEEGEAPPGADVDVEQLAAGTGIATETLEGGLIKYFKANSGAGLALVRPDRPGPGCQEFEDRIVTGAFYSIGWDPNFALAVKDPSGTLARIILEKIRRTILENQRIEAQAQLREDTFALSRAVEIGVIPKPKNGDVFSWEYFPNARLTADTGNEEGAKREKYKIGALTALKWAAEDGDWWEDRRSQKQVEVTDLFTRARELQKTFPEFSVQECLDRLEMLNPNGTPPAPAEADPSEGRAPQVPKKKTPAS